MRKKTCIEKKKLKWTFYGVAIYENELCSREWMIYDQVYKIDEISKDV